MDIETLKNRIKTRIRNFIFTNTTLKKLIPEKIRHLFSGRIMEHCVSRTSVPEPYIPGKYPKGINLFGFFKAENGLAQGCKLYAGALEAAGIPRTFLNTDFLDWLPQQDTAFDSRLSKAPAYAVNVIHINPDQWQEACGMFPRDAFNGHYNIGVFLWELETVPDTWIPIFDYIDEIWTPSEFIASAIRKSTDKPVTVIPYGIDTPKDDAVTRADFGLPEDMFLALTMYDSNSYASRKNPGAAMDAFVKAFGPKPEKARLVIKISNPKPEDLAFIESKLGANGPFILMTDRLDKPRLNALISLCDVFISLHRSEGFGLVMAEAMNLGVPVIATDWSSNTEFMPHDAACMVGYSLIPVGEDYQFGDGKRVWADANVEEAAAYLSRLAADADYRKEIAAAGQAYISQNLSVSGCGRKMAARLDQLIGS